MFIKILIFDTETNDKPKNQKLKAEDDLNNFPFILQIAFNLIELDTNTNNLKTLYRKVHYVQPFRKNKEIEIAEGAFKIHGINKDVCKERGLIIEDIVYLFQGLLNQSNVVVAHNFDFDCNVIISESLNLGIILNKPKFSRNVCTMKATTDIVALPSRFKTGEYKYPTLSELYKHLFNKELSDVYSAHDALEDVLATTDCVVELYKTSERFKKLIEGNGI